MKTARRRLTKTEAFGALAIVFALGLLYDFRQQPVSIIGLVFRVAFIILGVNLRQKGRKILGNVLFVLGALSLSLNLFNLFAVQWVFVAIIIYIGYQLLFGAAKETIQVEAEKLHRQRDFFRREPMFKNFLIGQRRSPDAIYDLDDMDFQFGLGDVSLDFSNTLIPEGETVILIRGLVGKIQLLIPYDVELSIQASTFVGGLHLLDQSDRVFNSTQKYQTRDYAQAHRKIRIIASTLIGDIEVKNI